MKHCRFSDYMKKFSLIILISIIILTDSFPLAFSQNITMLEKLQAEISDLVHFAKFSVVTVTAKSSQSFIVDRNEGLFSFFKNNHQEKRDSLWLVGSGVIYNENGYIISRSSILADFKIIKVTLSDKREYEAQYIGTDTTTGLAILKINAGNLQPTRIGNSDNVNPYSLVMVLGNSMGISPFAVFGLINGYTPDDKFILSAPINPGNIGGPVFNLKGEIIGIVVAQLETEVSMVGPMYLDYSHQTGIVLPMNQVAQIVDEIIQQEKENKGLLGIEFDPDSLSQNKLIVNLVLPGSPADRVGLKKGDQLLKYNDSDLLNADVAKKLIEQTKPGTDVSINFLRGNRPLKVFPCLDKKWPIYFNPRKPQHLTPLLLNQSNAVPIQFPVILSPTTFQEINTRMIQMENQIRSLKNQLQNSPQRLP